MSTRGQCQEYYNLHKEQISIKHAKYRENNKKLIKKQSKKYYITHKKEKQKAGKEYQKTHKEHIKNWRNNHKELLKSYNDIVSNWFAEFKKSIGCCICGYNKCGAALDFHHSDSSNKKLSVTSYGLYSGNLKILTELNKCILLCKNCHYEIHIIERRNKDA